MDPGRFRRDDVWRSALYAAAHAPQGSINQPVMNDDMSTTYTVLTADNFDFYDEDEVDSHGSFATQEEAIAAARALVDRSLRWERQQCTDPCNADELYDRWEEFGDSPFIRPDTAPPFSASEYAQARVAEICSEPTEGGTSSDTDMEQFERFINARADAFSNQLYEMRDAEEMPEDAPVWRAIHRLMWDGFMKSDSDGFNGCWPLYNPQVLMLLRLGHYVEAEVQLKKALQDMKDLEDERPVEDFTLALSLLQHRDNPGRIEGIVSSGQSGAYRGGLDASIHCRLRHGGWCPKGRRSDDGIVPVKYQLHVASLDDLAYCREVNVADSDVTLVFTYGQPQGEALLTVQSAQRLRKPHLHVDLNSGAGRKEQVGRIIRWIQASCAGACIVNVAGQLESEAFGIRGVVMAWMVDVISGINGTLFYPIPEDFPVDDEGDTPADVVDAYPSPRNQEDAVPQQQSTTLYHPRSIEEAVQTVLDVLSPDRLDAIRAQTLEEFTSFAHFGLAMGVRNSMIYRNENISNLMADFQRGQRAGQWEGEPEPDAVSRVIVELVWARLRS